MNTNTCVVENKPAIYITYTYTDIYTTTNSYEQPWLSRRVLREFTQSWTDKPWYCALFICYSLCVTVITFKQCPSEVQTAVNRLPRSGELGSGTRWVTSVPPHARGMGSCGFSMHSLRTHWINTSHACNAHGFACSQHASARPHKPSRNIKISHSFLHRLELVAEVLRMQEHLMREVDEKLEQIGRVWLERIWTRLALWSCFFIQLTRLHYNSWSMSRSTWRHCIERNCSWTTWASSKLCTDSNNASDSPLENKRVATRLMQVIHFNSSGECIVWETSGTRHCVTRENVCICDNTSTGESVLNWHIIYLLKHIVCSHRLARWLWHCQGRCGPAGHWATEQLRVWHSHSQIDQCYTRL